MRGWNVLAALLVVTALLLALPQTADAADKTTKYRVYQNENALAEFADLDKAKQYAQGFNNSYVEEIGTRYWLWSNFPRYRVYQFDVSLPEWEFNTLEEAKAVAQYYKYASIRDMHDKGWVWNSYPRYKLYQGDITLDSWEFVTLEEAKAAATYYKYMHVIDLNTNQWIWDNYTKQEKEEFRQNDPAYLVYQGNDTREDWKFSYIEDAIREAAKWENAEVIDISKGNKTVYQNKKRYQVYQDQNLINEFVNLDDALYYAQWYEHIRIKMNDREIWNNYKYYRVYQGENLAGEFSTLSEALQFSQWYLNVSIRTYHGVRIWNNYRKLLYMGWHGASASATIKAHLQDAIGLDISSPTWFHLKDESGALQDLSSKETVDWLKSNGFSVHPLVSNQFDSALTTKFLADKKAQQSFIRALVDKAAALGVDGLNIDFESISGKDRDALTAFVEALTAAAHEKGLLISIDLPRGSIRWNHLSAFDHEKLGGIVDYVITMAYDQHFSGSDKPGSVSGLPWAEEGVKEFLSYGIPREKLILGIPYYVRVWKLDAQGALVSNRSLYMKDIPALLESKKTTAVWDPEFAQYRVEYTEDGYRHVFWLENEETVKARIELAKSYDLAGIAAWRLGYETPGLWQSMLKQK